MPRGGTQRLQEEALFQCKKLICTGARHGLIPPTALLRFGLPRLHRTCTRSPVLAIERGVGSSCVSIRSAAISAPDKRHSHG